MWGLKMPSLSGHKVHDLQATRRVKDGTEGWRSRAQIGSRMAREAEEESWQAQEVGHGKMFGDKGGCEVRR